MGRKFLLFGTLFWIILNFAQDLKPVAKRISEYEKNKRSINYNLFELNNYDKIIDYRKTATDATVFNVKSLELKKLMKDKPEFIELSFPFDGDKEITVELYKNEIFTSDFKVKTKKDEIVPYTPGVYYQGIVKGDYNSVVSFSFFQDDVVGIISTPSSGNIILGKFRDSDNFVSYSESKLTVQNNFACDADKLPENINQKISFDPGKTNKKTLTDNCVRVYYEISNKVYLNIGSNTTSTINWITAVHNSVTTIYYNDDIKVSLSEIYVWTTQDPYIGDTNTNLDIFRNTRPVFNGDVAQLIAYPINVGLASINTLCTSWRHCYSPVTISYDQFPIYSWDINVTAHEMGHVLGSPHTHACAWNGNNTAIDGCGAIAGSLGSVCSGPIPATGGTIMSYCQVVSGVGVNFANGFGSQPAELIRNTVNSKSCLGTNCISPCSETIDEVLLTNITQNSISISIIDWVSLSWKYKLSKVDGTVVQYGVTNSSVFSLNNLDANTYYNLYIGTECSGSSAYQKYQTVLTDGNWCGGTQFTDSGGTTGTYSNNEKLTKTFYPLTDSKLRLIFTEFNLESFKDYMYIYNGPVGSPLFPNGNDLTGTVLPGIFSSTHPTGAITVEFFSDELGVRNGWKANLTCRYLAVEDINVKDNTVDIYPNPAKTMIIISSKEKLKSYKIYDEAGRLIKSAGSLKGNKTEVNLSSIQTGNYVVSIETETQTITKKLIKQ